MKTLLNYYSTIKELLVISPILCIVILIIWSLLFPRNANAGDFRFIQGKHGIYCITKDTLEEVDSKYCVNEEIEVL
jgi:hypothetical protein